MFALVFGYVPTIFSGRNFSDENESPIKASCICGLFNTLARQKQTMTKKKKKGRNRQQSFPKARYQFGIHENLNESDVLHFFYEKYADIFRLYIVRNPMKCIYSPL